jgi:hypothetical protein
VPARVEVAVQFDRVEHAGDEFLEEQSGGDADLAAEPTSDCLGEFSKVAVVDRSPVANATYWR